MYGPPPPLGLVRPSRNETRYRLKVVQNPVHARCCGFGEKDRRLVDPPAILQLFEETDDGRVERVTNVDSTLFVVHCDLYCENKKESRSLVCLPSTVPPEPSGMEQGIFSIKEPKYVRNLTGTLTANANHLLDDKKLPGIFFIFHDLSVRTDGWFTLKFMFMDLDAGEPFTMSTGVKAETFSEPFRVYTAKKFPGMTESTPLSKAFAKQGIKIVVRREPSFSRASDKYYKMLLPGHTFTKPSPSSSSASAAASNISSATGPSSFSAHPPPSSSPATAVAETETLPAQNSSSSNNFSIQSLMVTNDVDPAISTLVSSAATYSSTATTNSGQSPLPYTRIAIADVLSAAPDDNDDGNAPAPSSFS